jgi:hypothetical protein
MRVPWSYENPACAEVGVDFFYPEVEDADRTHNQLVVKICNRCPHLAECAEWGINRERFGTWGGIAASRRKAIRQARGITLPREEHVA